MNDIIRQQAKRREWESELLSEWENDKHVHRGTPKNVSWHSFFNIWMSTFNIKIATIKKDVRDRMNNWVSERVTKWKTRS